MKSNKYKLLATALTCRAWGWLGREWIGQPKRVRHSVQSHGQGVILSLTDSGVLLNIATGRDREIKILYNTKDSV